MPDKLYYSIRYFVNYGRFPHINNPKTFNVKILNRMLYDRNYLYTKLADKYLVRKYVEEKIGKEYLVPLKYVFSNAGDLASMTNWRNIIIKPNHACSMIEMITEEPTEEGKKKIIEKCESWLKVDFSRMCREHHYRKIPRKILVEESLCINDKVPNDYKFHCFPQSDGGLFTVLQVVNGRYSSESRGYYLNGLDDCVWQHGHGNHQVPDEDKPVLRKAIELCKVLSGDFNYVRIDWYVIKGKLYFGELTFTPGAGTVNEFGAELERKMFDYWVL
jgi:hypothetical protein